MQDFNDTAQYRALQHKLAEVLKVYWWDKVPFWFLLPCMHA
jgi:hypothetical protein